jgi:putative ubiquitin-RnfH superfamily antitoxin RatB of RatAB toxin-antitoxin module
MAPPDAVRATVVYARPDVQWELPVCLPLGATLVEAVLASGLLARAPELDAATVDLGVYNRPLGPATPLRDGDRIEVYRPLVVDPMMARRLRAQPRTVRPRG